MKKQHFFITFLALVFFGLLGYYFIHNGYYPIAMVNGEFIGAHRLNKESTVRYSYYTKTAALGGMTAEDKNSLFFEFRRMALGGLIEDMLIEQGLRGMTDGDIKKAAEQRLTERETDINGLSTVASTLYGLDLADFKTIVLLPQAKKDMLRERIMERGSDAEDWFAETKKTARVRLFSTQFSWDGNGVVAKIEFGK